MNTSCSDENEKEVAKPKKIEKLIKFRLMKYTRQRKLLCKNGLALEITNTGNVQGTDRHDTPSAIFQVISIGANMVAFMAQQSNLYLAVDEFGRIYSAPKEKRDCVFVEQYSPDFHNLYQSYHTETSQTEPLFLTLQPNGRVTMATIHPQNSMFIWEIAHCSFDNNNNQFHYLDI